MGTWSITTPVSVTSKTGFQYCNLTTYGTDNASLIAAIIDPTFVNQLGCGATLSADSAISGTIRFAFNYTNAIIKLDGDPAISYSALPAGFTPLSAILSVQTGFNGTGDGVYLQHSELDESAKFWNGSEYFTASFPYDFSTLPPSMLNIINNGFGVRFAFGNNNNSDVVGIFQLTGTYLLFSFQYTLQNPGPMVPGTIVTVTSNPADPTALQFNHIITPTFTYVDTFGNNKIVPITNIITQTANLFQFYFPDIIPDDPTKVIILQVTGDGTQFSGIQPLGTLNVLYANASGIYVLTPNKFTDTIYDRSGTTAEVKIPNPSWKNGFIGG